MKGRRGFTLVELLVASSMMALLAGAGYVVFAAGVRSAQTVREVSAKVARAERALAAMAADIRAAVEHDGVRLTSLDATYEGKDSDTIDFIAARTRRAADDPEASSRCEVGYYIDNDPATESRWLLRREDSTIDDDALEGGTFSQAGAFVSELNLEFYDGLEWVSGWEDQEKFPVAVRIGVVVVDEALDELADEAEMGEPMYFETTVSIQAR